ncbi:MAG: helix-turn-helix domain-containing protein [Alphaproteobacteria bacterium]
MGGLKQTVVHAEKINHAIQSNEMAMSALVASWQRSLSLHHLDPTNRRPPQRLTELELRIARQRIEPLIEIAKSSLDRLYLAVGAVGCCVLLADKYGVPVERRGATGDDKTFHDWGLWPGSIWSEESEGTNAIGTCLVEHKLITIHRDQHFFSRNTLLSCVTAPIHDHEGKLLAALDVSSCRADLTEGYLKLIATTVSDAARCIETEYFRKAFPKARILFAPTTQNAASALLAVDQDDLVIGASRSARIALGLTQTSFKTPLPAADILGGEKTGRDNFSDAERSVVQRAMIRANGKVAVAARELGISRATLHRKLARLGLRSADSN